ncbi:phenylacetate--CoA ligase family protein [Roseateles albus]|uniref:Phenylacetate--CoA ligase family protein n=1 Tax=Roseateles albus TaxID=2987525 RepID=A0ABT5KEW5_9BURK|nr:phenylacetate--CoA ligase family protein [Roseateles albus]MDC8772084.1 phenylacetate--CoA ligase family protein [Roseateles albus]
MYSAKYYVGSPVWLQEAMLSVRGWVRGSMREGAAMKKELDEVLRTQWLDPDELSLLQLKRLRATVTHAGLHVPFYREHFKAAGFEPGDLKSLADVSKIPQMTKMHAFEAGRRMTSEVHSGLKFEAHTSGTTGLAMTSWRDLHSINRENAFVWRQMIWAGFKPGDRRAWIRGDKIVPADQKVAPFWRHNRGEDMLMLSSYHLSELTADAYIEALELFDPSVFLCYPSAILMLARYLISNGRRYKGKSLRGMMTSSETVTDEHRRLVSEAFGVQIFDWYGACERMTAIGTCEHGKYHVMADYSYTELEPELGGSCSVVGTSFDNKLMPWIRYKLGDEIMPAPTGSQCTCGRHFPLVSSLIGRIDDYVISPDGRHVNMMSNAIDNIPHILEGQVRQDSLDELTLVLALVPGAPFDEAAAIEAVRTYIGHDMKVKVHLVESVPRTGNGKLRVVVRTV